MPFWGIAKNLQGGCTGEAEMQRLDLKGELVAHCSSGNAPLHRPPVSNRGGVVYTTKSAHLFARIGLIGQSELGA
jgi:hypothetical protein